MSHVALRPTGAFSSRVDAAALFARPQRHDVDALLEDVAAGDRRNRLDGPAGEVAQLLLHGSNRFLGPSRISAASRTHRTSCASSSGARCRTRGRARATHGAA